MNGIVVFLWELVNLTLLCLRRQNHPVLLLVLSMHGCQNWHSCNFQSLWIFQHWLEWLLLYSLHYVQSMLLKTVYSSANDNRKKKSQVKSSHLNVKYLQNHTPSIRINCFIPMQAAFNCSAPARKIFAISDTRRFFTSWGTSSTNRRCAVVF